MLNYRYSVTSLKSSNSNIYSTSSSQTEATNSSTGAARLASGVVWAVGSLGGWWSGYRDYAASTIYYDEQGVAHSSMLFWF